MLNTQKLPVQKLQPVTFKTQLNWLGNKKGNLSADDVQGTIHVATPFQFGGEGQEWSPEHLFLGSISGCFMTTFLLFARKLDVALSNFSCAAMAQINLVNGKYEFTQINLLVKLNIMDESLRGKTIQVLQKTQQHGLVSNVVKCPVHYRSEIHVGFHVSHKEPVEVHEHIM